MRIKFVQKNYEMGEKLQDVITKKVSKFNRYFDENATFTITMEKQKGDMYKMELSIRYNDNFMRAEVLTDNMYDNIDIVLPKIEKQIFKYRTKLEKKLKTNAFKEEVIYKESSKEEEKPIVAKTKQFYLQPMGVEDAIFQLDMIDHDFYVFINEENQLTSIVYRRLDGDIGLLEAEAFK